MYCIEISQTVSLEQPLFGKVKVRTMILQSMSRFSCYGMKKPTAVPGSIRSCIDSNIQVSRDIGKVRSGSHQIEGKG